MIKKKKQPNENRNYLECAFCQSRCFKLEKNNRDLIIRCLECTKIRDIGINYYQEIVIE